MKLVVGLGNPGSRYAETYHNVGYKAVDHVLRVWDHEEHGVTPGTLYRLKQSPLGFAGKPDCYVNESGELIKQWLDELELSPESLLVIYDDFSLDIGTIRLRPSGRSGGHRGLQSIIDVCETNDIPRLRIGIGPVPTADSPEEFVLSPIADSDRELLRSVLSSVPDILQSIDEDGFDAAMSQWNGSDFNATG